MLTYQNVTAYVANVIYLAAAYIYCIDQTDPITPFHNIAQLVSPD